MKYILLTTSYEVITREDVRPFLKANPSTSIEVIKTKGGWKPLNKEQYGGNIPIKAKLIK